MDYPVDPFEDIYTPPVNMPIDEEWQHPQEQDDPLTILLRQERTGEFLFSLRTSPFYPNF